MTVHSEGNKTDKASLPIKHVNILAQHIGIFQIKAGH